MYYLLTWYENLSLICLISDGVSKCFSLSDSDNNMSLWLPVSAGLMMIIILVGVYTWKRKKRSGRFALHYIFIHFVCLNSYCTLLSMFSLWFVIFFLFLQQKIRNRSRIVPWPPTQWVVLSEFIIMWKICFSYYA